MSKLFDSSCAILLAFAALISCEPESPQPSDPDIKKEPAQIVFSKAVVSGESEIPEMALGLSVSDPVNADNVKVTIDAEGNFVPEIPLYWGLEQTKASTFTAYFPYNAAYTGQSVVEFNVLTDQSSKHNLELSQFIAGSTTARPSDPSVQIVLEYRMAGLDIWFDNRSGKTISRVFLQGVKAKMHYDMSSTVCTTAPDPLSDIVMCWNGKDDKGYDNYLAVLPPQRTDVKMVVEFSDGTAKTCSLGEERQLEAKVYHNDLEPILLVDDSIQNIKFSMSVKDWTYGGSLSFTAGSIETYEFELRLCRYSDAFSGNSYDDYNYLICYMHAENLKSFSAAFLTSELYNELKKEMSDESIVKEYGSSYEYNIADIEKGTYFLYRCQPGTEYTMVASTENLDGHTGTIASSCATLAYPDCNLVLGNYNMKCSETGEDDFIYVTPTAEANVYKVSFFNFDNLSFKAVHDVDARTLTISGVAVGYENMGNLFGEGIYDETIDDIQYEIRYVSVADSTSSSLAAPLVFGIDADGYICSMKNYRFGIELFNPTDGSVYGYYFMYYGRSTILSAGKSGEERNIFLYEPRNAGSPKKSSRMFEFNRLQGK